MFYRVAQESGEWGRSQYELGVGESLFLWPTHSSEPGDFNYYVENFSIYKKKKPTKNPSFFRLLLNSVNILCVLWCL